MLRFDWAQSFYVDASAVDDATEVAITRIDLYFRTKPPAEGNKSGIYKPGVSIKIVPTLGGKPVVNQVGAYRPTEPVEHGAKFAFYSQGQTARVEYDDILASANALVPTAFLFESPIFVPTNGEYAAVIKFDGAENFILWYERTGYPLVGDPTKVSTGPSGNFRGTLYQFISDPSGRPPLLPNTNYAYSNHQIDPALANNAALVFTANNNPLESSDPTYLQANWTRLIDQQLKISVYVARYMINGQSVQLLEDYAANGFLTSTIERPVILPANVAYLSNNMIRLTAPVQETEYILYSLRNSVRDPIHYGEMIYQDGPSYPGNKNSLTVSCNDFVISANGNYTYTNGATFNSVGGFGQVFNATDNIILKDLSTNDIYMRVISEIPSNTTILVTMPFETSINATFRVAPIAFVQELANTVMFNKKRELLTLYNSMVNAAVRFVGNSIANVTIANTGNAYSNNDYVKIGGFEDVDFSVKGNYAAYANIVTFANGSISNVLFSNTGAGFNNVEFLGTTNVHIYKSTGGVMSTDLSNGVGANLVFTVGTTLKSLMGNTQFANCEIINFEVSRMKPEIWVNNPLGTSFTVTHRTKYHSVRDPLTSTGKAYYVDTPAEMANTDTIGKIYKSTKLNIPAVSKTPVLTSRSNEYAIRFANGALNTVSNWGDPFSNTCVFLFDISSNNDYQVVWFDPEIVVSHYSRYIINNEYTNEHTNYGEAIAKHCATRINLATNMTAEDVVVYMDVYRPVGTDFRVYARVKNAKDESAFDELDWSLLEEVDGIGLYSSGVDDSDYKELTYNLRAYPNTDFTLSGSVQLKQGNAHVIGTGTIFGPRANTVGAAGGTGYTNGDIISFTAPTGLTDTAQDNIFAYKASVNATANVTTNSVGGITALTLINVGYGWTSQSNVTSFSAAKANGAVSGGTGASLFFNPGLQQYDLIKIYSPYDAWANVNYTTAVVNSVVSNTDLVIVRTYGELGVTLTGNVNISTGTTTLAGTGTLYSTEVSVGDLIAIWANSSVYEVKSITAIANNTSLTLDSVGTFNNTATIFATVLPDTFMNASLTVDNLLVDRIAYPHQAFNNAGRDNVCRYYNSSMVSFDGFDTMQIKIVLLSDSDYIIPKVDDVRGIMVSA